MSDPESQPTFVELADLARSLAHPHRLALLDHVEQGEFAVERLAELSGLSMANTSQHLQQLRRAGLVQTRRDGKRVLYRLGGGPVAEVLAALRAYAKHMRGEIRALVADSFRQPEKLQAMSREELLGLMRSDDVVLLDVRPEDEFHQGHLPGALNIPADELERRLAELPAGQQIVAYCRGPHCVLSLDAVVSLRAKGLRARRLEDGFPDWKAAGLPIEKR